MKIKILFSAVMVMFVLSVSSFTAPQTAMAAAVNAVPAKKGPLTTFGYFTKGSYTYEIVGDASTSTIEHFYNITTGLPVYQWNGTATFAIGRWFVDLDWRETSTSSWEYWAGPIYP